jgi:hypothetical protein
MNGPLSRDWLVLTFLVFQGSREWSKDQSGGAPQNVGPLEEPSMSGLEGMLAGPCNRGCMSTWFAVDIASGVHDFSHVGQRRTGPD